MTIGYANYWEDAIKLGVVGSTPAFLLPLSRHFGDGSAGWLQRDVPANTLFDFVAGRAVTEGFSLGRAPGGGWAKLS